MLLLLQAVAGGPLSVPVSYRDTIYNLYLVTYATDVSRPDFCTFAASAAGHGFLINIMGQTRQEQYSEAWQLDKAWGLRDFVKSLPDEPGVIVTMVDSYDVLLNGSPQQMVATFVDMGHRVLHGAERGCSGTKWDLMHRDNGCDSKWPLPLVRTTSPFLNGGAVIGFRAELAMLLDIGWKEHQATHQALLPGEMDPYVIAGDQQLFSQLFSYGRHDRGSSKKARRQLRQRLGVSIDYQSRIFLCMYKVNAEREIDHQGGFTSTSDCSHLDRRMSIKACVGVRPMRTEPVVFHCNGPDKTVCMETVGRSLAVVSSNRSELLMWFWEGGMQSLADVCGATIIQKL